MKKLRFQIRTWNRAKKLEICIRRIAEEIKKIGKEDKCVIFVIDNHSTDETPKILKKLQKEIPFLVIYRYPKWCEQIENLTIPSEIWRRVKAQFVWFFGDDDILLKDTLPIVWKVLSSEDIKNPAFISVANSLFKPHSYKIYKGTVIELMNLMGYNQFAGWITGTIWNTKLCKEPLKILWCGKEELEVDKNYDKFYSIYFKTAFIHVLMLLHFCAYSSAIVVDYPIVEPMEVGDPDTAERWEMENVGWRYFNFIKGLKVMFDEGILKEKLKPRFFKYLTYNLWDRFLFEMIASRIGVYTRNPRPDEGWEIILNIADLINDPTLAKQIRINVYLAKELCKQYQSLKQEVETISNCQNEKKEKLQRVLNDLYQKMLFLLNEINKPIFEKGWAGKGYIEKN